MTCSGRLLAQHGVWATSEARVKSPAARCRSVPYDKEGSRLANAQKRNEQIARDYAYLAADFAAGVTRHTVLPTSSATSSAPCLSILTPTGRPRASPLPLRNPVSTSCGLPEGLPSANGRK